MNNKSTKKALISSLLILAMCFSMLVGTTFAWFTDNATSSGNVIKTGTLNIALEKWDETANAWVSTEKAPIFNYDNWEPGYTQIVNLRVANLGTLALKWQAIITTETSISKLADVISVYVRSDDRNDTVREYIDTVDRDDFASLAAKGEFKKFTLRQFIENLTVMTQGTLEPAQNSYLGLVLQMEESAGNEYMDLSLGGKFDITILATQTDYENEKDSYGDDYDIDAPFVGSTIAPAATPEANPGFIDVYNTNDEKIATFDIPAGAVTAGTTQHTINVVEVEDYDLANITVPNGSETKTVNISVTGLKADNEAPIKVNLYIGMGLDPATVVVYHYDKLILSTYNPYDGYVSFETTSFSPFTLVYDAESEFIPPVADVDGAPVAIVNSQPQYVGVSLPWGSYGQWSPNKNVDADPKLEAAYVFTCAETLEEAKKNAYANWECDFFVKLDAPLAENQIFLGGNYGSFGWVGFHNGDVVLNANEEVALLGSVTNTPWTYLDVVQFVGTFICGVGDVDDALSGATFTVTLRLTNPENKSDTIDISTITYTFQ